MIRALFKHSFIYTITGIFTSGISFILFPFYTRYLKPTDYGVLDCLTALGGFIAVTVAFEVTQGLSRFMPEIRENLTLKRIYASTSLWFSLFMYTFFLALSLLCRKKISFLVLGSTEYVDLMTIALCSFWMNGLVYRFYCQLRAELRPKAVSALSLVNVLSNALFAILFVLIQHLGLIGVLKAQVISGLFATLIGLYLTHNSFRVTFDFKILKKMLSYSLPLVPSSVGVILSIYVDRIAIRELMSLDDVGVYGAGARVASIATFLTLGIQGALTPLIYAHYNDPETPKKLVSIFNLFVAGALIFLLLLSSFAPIIMSILAPAAYSHASSVIVPLAFAALCPGFCLFAPGNDIAKKTKIIASINVVSALVNVLLNLILIPHLGIVGSALATMFSSCLMFGLYMFFSQRQYYIPYPWFRLIIAAFSVYFLISVSALVDLSLYSMIGINVIGSLLLVSIVFKSHLQRFTRFAQ